MDRQQTLPWVHTALILFLLSPGGAIEIPMDREFVSALFLLLLILEESALGREVREMRGRGGNSGFPASELGFSPKT